MGVETAALIITATAAAASTGVSIANYEASKGQANAQKELADQQAAQLRDQEAARQAEAATAAKTGSVFGFPDTKEPHPLATGFGFGTAPTTSANAGRAQITGMS